MIIPSIDIMNGHAVQLVGGKTLQIDAGDPEPIAKNFSLVGQMALIDLDAAMGQGSNKDIMKPLLGMADCRVGGGIRDLQTALEWLDAGAAKVILGTAAQPELLSQLPRERVMAALDAVNGEIVVEGWQSKTGRRVEERIAELRPYVSGFLITMVEREGRMQGADLERAKILVEAAKDCEVTIAGGVTTTDEIAALDTMGADAQVGMALYTGRMNLADAVAAPLHSDRADGLFPTVVVDVHGMALGLAYSSRESLREAFSSRRGVYHSRTRGLWRKGSTSGDTQELLRVDADCDRDTLRFWVRQHGRGFCHRQTCTCWGDARGLAALEQRLQQRRKHAPDGSYTKRLYSDQGLLRAKLQEEAQELAEAADDAHIANEAADLLYFALVKLHSQGLALADVANVLDQRARRITRRGGDAKPHASGEQR